MCRRRLRLKPAMSPSGAVRTSEATIVLNLVTTSLSTGVLLRCDGVLWVVAPSDHHGWRDRAVVEHRASERNLESSLSLRGGLVTEA